MNVLMESTRKEDCFVSVYEALVLMIGFSTFIVAFLDLVVHIIDHLNDKK
ncbi:hypothetical protein CIRMBP1281_00667 [Enterococcus cecorum]|nr:hypothetical protein CIRMBP1281_00667 [Enterococcus cecorum]CAI3301082.1 hypothetical protein CIRMBP1228_00659 [Enterococcus cecorum]